MSALPRMVLLALLAAPAANAASRPKDSPLARWPAGCYLVDFARSRHADPTRIPVSANADRYQTGNNPPLTLDQLMTALRSVRHVEARYIEHRTLHVLRTPIETRGSLRFDAPAHLEKATDPATNGAAERLMIDGDQLTIDRGTGAAPFVLSLREHPEIGILVESIRATLSGDGDALRRIFDVTPSGTLSHWQLVLQPRGPGQHGLLQWMRVSGYGERITEIETADNEGDRSEMMIVEQTP